jgi:O-antigen ligase
LVSIVCLIGLFINLGRTAQLAFFITLIIFAIYNIKNILSWRYIIAILAVGAFFYFAGSLGKLERFKIGVHQAQSAIEKKEFTGSGGFRVYAWYASYDIIKRHPVFGVGVGDNIDEFKLFAEKHPGEAGDFLMSLHNQHLDTLTRYGVVGYVLLWGSVLWLLTCLKKNRRFFPLALIFFSITFFDGLGDIILLMKPYNNIFIVMFILFSIIVYKEDHLKNSN